MVNNLIVGERINFSEEITNEQSKPTPEAINEKYKKGDVRIVTEQARYPLNAIVDMVDSEDYNLNPEFQRRHRWNTAKKSKLIESFIMNVPIPPIFLYENDYSAYEVMDGLQRLTAISQFYKDEFELEGLEEWKELNGYRYSSLPEQIRKGIDRRYLSSVILLQETAKSEKEADILKQLVFERINSGGEKLTAQEVRNALYPGGLNSLTIKLSRNEYFCRMWNIPEPDKNEISDPSKVSTEVIQNSKYKNMSDAELVLRFFAYRNIAEWQGSTIEGFLDDFLKIGNIQFNKEILHGLEFIFSSTVKFAFDLFGDDAFKIYRKSGDNWFLKNRPTKIIYDPLMQVLSKYLDIKDRFLIQKDDIIKGMKALQIKESRYFEGRNTNKADVNKRIGVLDTFFKSFT